MTEDSKKAGQQYANYLKLLCKSIVADNNRRAREHAERDAAAFSAAFKAGKCSICGGELTSYVADEPCLHWLLRPDGFQKRDLLRVTDRYGMHQIEKYMRRVASQEGGARNINDLAIEGTGKLVELTAKHKDLEWSISCAKSDYDGHESENEASKKPHYHFQMRIGGKPFIDYGDFHIPLHHRDILEMETERLASEHVVRRYAGVESMRDVLTGENVEKLALDGRIAENEADGLVKLDHFVVAEKGKPMRVEDVLAAAREAAAQGKPKTAFLRELPNVTVQTMAEPGPGVIEQAVRRKRGQQRDSEGP